MVERRAKIGERLGERIVILGELRLKNLQAATKMCRCLAIARSRMIIAAGRVIDKSCVEVIRAEYFGRERDCLDEKRDRHFGFSLVAQREGLLERVVQFLAQVGRLRHTLRDGKRKQRGE